MFGSRAAVAPPPSPDGLAWLVVIAAVLTAFVGRTSSLVDAWKSEFIGTAILVALTFPPGQWWGLDQTILGMPCDWIFHAAGVVLADWTCGGPHVNPGITLTFFCLGKCEMAVAVVNVIAQCSDATVGFLVCQAYAEARGWKPLSGPEVAPELSGPSLATACLHEFGAMVALCLIVFAVNFEPPARYQAHRSFYFVKQTATAIGVRAIIILCPAAGPAINPALAMGVYACATGALPAYSAFWYVYWLASAAGALAAAAAYALYTPKVSFFGTKLRAATKAKRK